MTSEKPYADTRDMYAVHAMFRREFGLMPVLVRSVPVGDKERSQIVADHIELMSFVLHHHHQGEDKHLWPRLLERVSESVAPVVQMMESHHENIEKIAAEVQVAGKIWRSSATSGSGKALAEAMDRLVPLLHEHMALEEQQVLPLAEQCITAAEWSGMVQEAVRETPREHLPLIFGMVMYEGDPEIIEQILFELPPEARPVMKDLASQAFAAHAQRVYGSATPPRSVASNH
jgi:hemerythrin-like domain-containing protein